MPSKSKDVRIEQLRIFEKKLALRLQQLDQKGISKEKAQSDPLVKSLKSKIRETNVRIAAVEKFVQINEKLAQAKAQKLAEPEVKKEEKSEPAKDAKQAKPNRKRRKSRLIKNRKNNLPLKMKPHQKNLKSLQWTLVKRHRKKQRNNNRMLRKKQRPRKKQPRKKKNKIQVKIKINKKGRTFYSSSFFNEYWRPHGESNPGYSRERAVS